MAPVTGSGVFGTPLPPRSGERAGAALLLDHHRAVVDIAGGDRAAAGRRDGAGSPQVVGAVGVGAETAAQGAACEAVLAVPGVGAACTGERVAIGVAGRSNGLMVFA